jgi:hypothetical protein
VSRFRLNRRALLRGAGGVAIALPWLEIMGTPKPVHAAAQPARRFVAVYTPGGSVLENWLPKGTRDDFELSPILSPLESVRSHLVVAAGLEMKVAKLEAGHPQAGMVAWLTGCSYMEQGNSPPETPSLDIVLARLLSGDPAAEPLYQAIRWATGIRDGGRGSRNNIVSYRAGALGPEPVLPRIDPKKTWQLLFGELPMVEGSWRKSTLDAVLQRYKKLSLKLGSRDRQRLEQHMSQLRRVEQEVKAQCAPPELPDLAGYDPSMGPMQSQSTDAAIPKVGKLMMDMLVMALACEKASVATLQWADAVADYTLPWLDLPGNQVQNHYEHNREYHPIELTKIFTWYSAQHAYLIEQMAASEMGPGLSLLNESVVFFGSHQQNPADHTKTNMPFLLAGGGGGLRGNRFLQFDGRSHNDLLTSIANLCGDSRSTFGDPGYCKGPLPEL